MHTVPAAQMVVSVTELDVLHTAITATTTAAAAAFVVGVFPMCSVLWLAVLDCL